LIVERRAPSGRRSPLAVISDLLKNRPVWDWEGRDWPNRRASRFVQAGGLRWHVQQLGRGPLVLLVHGTGAATHSWGSLAPLLARRFSVVAPDLPGHGFTGTPESQRLSLPGMAEALGELLKALGVSPALAIGHSAGAAVLARMSLDGRIAPRGLISLNGALLPLRGAAGHLFSPLAKLLAVNPLVPRLFALRAADRSVVEGLLRGTGSTLQPAAVDFYARLLRNPGHVAGALAMMANWDLRPLERDLPHLQPPLVLVVGDEDRTVPPAEAGRVRALLPTAELVTLPGLGHLAHEERPERIAELVIGLARGWSVLPVT
jgi:magnesium chelatase accessory protein